MKRVKFVDLSFWIIVCFEVGTSFVRSIAGGLKWR